MKLITRTFTSDKSFNLESPTWSVYFNLLFELQIDRSMSYHDDGKLIYAIEICKDEQLEKIQRFFAVSAKDENFEARGITYTENIQDAFDKK